MRKKGIEYLFLFLFVFISLFGCTMKKASNIDTLNEKTNNIVSKVSKLAPIDKVNVLTTKDTALIGVNLKENQIIGISNKKRLRQEIKEIVKNIDPQIKNVFISSDSNINLTIKNISKNIQKGKRVDLNWEIKNIVTKITPNI